MFSTTVPEAPVDEDGHSSWTEDYVRSHFSVSALNCPTDPEAITKRMQGPSNLHFRPGVDAAVGFHRLGSMVRRGPGRRWHLHMVIQSSE